MCVTTAHSIRLVAFRGPLPTGTQNGSRHPGESVESQLDGRLIWCDSRTAPVACGRARRGPYRACKKPDLWISSKRPRCCSARVRGENGSSAAPQSDRNCPGSCRACWRPQRSATYQKWSFTIHRAPVKVSPWQIGGQRTLRQPRDLRAHHNILFVGH